MVFVSVPTLQPVLSPKDSVSDIFQRNCGSDSRLDASELQLFLGAVSLEGASFAVTLRGVAMCPARYPGPCGAWQCVPDVDIYHERHGNVSHTLPQGPLGRGDVHLPNRNVLVCQTSRSLVCAFVKRKFPRLWDQ